MENLKSHRTSTQTLSHATNSTLKASISNDKLTQPSSSANTLPALKHGQRRSSELIHVGSAFPADKQTQGIPKGNVSTPTTTTPHQPHPNITSPKAVKPQMTADAQQSYHPVPRPWQEARRCPPGTRTRNTADGFAPMERWEQESLSDQAWNQVAGFRVEGRGRS
jgi:hypothetical protein